MGENNFRVNLMKLSEKGDLSKYILIHTKREYWILCANIVHSPQILNDFSMIFCNRLTVGLDEQQFVTKFFCSLLSLAFGLQ